MQKDPLAFLSQLFRYYQAGIVNTAFGYGLVVVLLALGLNVYLAQFLAHTAGVTFNYFTYSRHAFRDSEGSKPRFVLAYAVNYLLGLGALAATLQVISSPYLAGLVSILFVSFLNFFVLKHLVFFRRPTA